MGPPTVKATAAYGGQNHLRTPSRDVAGFWAVWFMASAERSAGPFQTIRTMHAATITAKLAGLFAGSLLTLFVVSLASEDQRHFVACRATGATADACLLQISGR